MAQVNPVNPVKQEKVGMEEARREILEKKAKDEFAAVFYKEMLKQSFSGDFMADEKGPYSQMVKETFIDKMAMELARKNSGMMPDIK